MPSAFRRAGTTTSEISTSSSSLGNFNTNTNNTRTVTRASSITPSSYRLRGVKPWQGGSYLTSVGLNDLDSILGGGQVLGTSILLEEDRLWTRDLAITLVKYWCAEVCFCCCYRFFCFPFSECRYRLKSYHYCKCYFLTFYAITIFIKRQFRKSSTW